MDVLFAWWLIAELVGLIALPLAAIVFANLPDRGWGLARPFGLLILGWLIWFPLSIVTALPYNRGWIIGTMVVLALGNAVLLWRWHGMRAALRDLVRREWRYLAASEIVFAGSLALMGWLRSFTPAVVDQEKFMDVAFLSSIWRAPHLPPPDPWLSGWPINYYYFGHFLVATVAKLLGTQPSVAFNASVALIFALTASTVFAVAINLVAALRAGNERPLSRVLPFGLVSIAFVLFLGNLNAAQQWWQQAVTTAQQSPQLLSNPWAWWLHPDLWLQFNWWNPSRVVPNTINEFPAFSFILSDLHAHVLALPFDALALAATLNLLLARGDGLRAFGVGLTRVLALGATGIILGALYAINGWDLPTYLGLAILALAIQQWIGHDRRGNALFWLDLAAAGILLIALAIFLFIPFYRGYLSPAGGLGVVPPSKRSPIGDEIAIFGLPLFLTGSLLVLRLGAWLSQRLASREHGGEMSQEASSARASWRAPARAALLAGGLLLALLTWLTAGFTGWTLIWSLLLMAGAALIAIWPLVPSWSPEHPRYRGQVEIFIWGLVATAAALVGVCEVIYLRDVFDGSDLFRMNTVFKFYYQVWLLLGVASGPVLAMLLPAMRAQLSWLFVPVAALLQGTPFAMHSREIAAAPLVLAGASPADISPHTHSAGSPAGSRLTLTASQEQDAATGASESGGADEVPSRVQHATPTGPDVLRWAGAGGTLIWGAALLVLLAASLIYPVQAAAARTVNFSLPRTLDGTAYMAGDLLNAGDAQAIAWLNNPAHVAGDPVIVEATGGEYSHFGRVSAFTGLPTILGWGAHEYQWRANWLSEPQHANELNQRTNAINQIYTNTNPQVVLGVLQQYHVRYVYVGAAERQAYPTADLARFASFLRAVYHTGGVTIYTVR